MVKMRKKLSSAVRGIRRQLSTKPSAKEVIPADPSAPSAVEGDSIAIIDDIDAEQERDADIDVVENEESVGVVGERDDVDTEVEEGEEEEEVEGKPKSVVEEDEEEEDNSPPAITESSTETEVELQLSGSAVEDEVKEGETPDEIPTGKGASADDAEVEPVDEVTPEPIMDEEPELKVEDDEEEEEPTSQPSADEASQHESETEEEEEKPVEGEAEPDEQLAEPTESKDSTGDRNIDIKTSADENATGEPALDDDEEPVLEDIPVDDTVHQLKAKSSSVEEESPVPESDEKSNPDTEEEIPLNPTVETDVIPRTNSSQSVPKMKVENEKVSPLAFCCF